MRTNAFKLGGLHQISWFQFLPHETELNPLPDKSVEVEQKYIATLLVRSSHLQLQKEGFLSTWVNSLVGPWDPYHHIRVCTILVVPQQLFCTLVLPSTFVVETAQSAVFRLEEEVAAALSQALRNCIERKLIGLSYMRFGDVFSKYHPSQSDKIFRDFDTICSWFLVRLWISVLLVTCFWFKGSCRRSLLQFLVRFCNLVVSVPFSCFWSTFWRRPCEFLGYLLDFGTISLGFWFDFLFWHSLFWLGLSVLSSLVSSMCSLLRLLV